MLPFGRFDSRKNACAIGLESSPGCSCVFDDLELLLVSNGPRLGLTVKEAPLGHPQESENSAQTIQVHCSLEAVRERPAMYIGNVNLHASSTRQQHSITSVDRLILRIIQGQQELERESTL